MEFSSLAKSVTWMLLTSWNKTEGGKTHKQAATEGGCSKGPAKHLKGGYSAFGDAHIFQTSYSHWLRGIFIEVLRKIFIFINVVVFPVTSDKLGTMYKEWLQFVNG